MPDVNAPVSLAEFAATSPESRPRCILCAVDADIEQQARAGKNAGVTYRTIGLWLETIVGEPVSKGRLERHFQMAHVHPSLNGAL